MTLYTFTGQSHRAEPLTKYLKDSADHEKDGYKATVTGYVYTHTYSGNLLLKAK